MLIQEIKAGDVVTRRWGGSHNEYDGLGLLVSEVNDTEIICGPWKFSRITGGEIDEFLDWDGVRTGSFLIGLEIR